MNLKEKLHQAFMQIGWMESDFRNLRAKFGQIWKIQSRAMIFQSFDNFFLCRPLTWHSATVCDVTTVQLLNGTIHKFHKIFPLLYRFVRTKTIVHAFIIELDQPDYWYPRKIKNGNNLCTKSMESCSLIVESQILAEFRPERATHKTLHI